MSIFKISSNKKQSSSVKFCSEQGHTNKIRNILCMNEDCPQKGFICSMCLFSYHRDHLDQCQDVDLIKIGNNNDLTDDVRYKTNFIIEDAIQRINSHFKLVKGEFNDGLEIIQQKVIQSLREIRPNDILGKYVESKSKPEIQSRKKSPYNSNCLSITEKKELEDDFINQDTLETEASKYHDHDTSLLRIKLPSKESKKVFTSNEKMRGLIDSSDQSYHYMNQLSKDKDEEIMVLKNQNEALQQNVEKLTDDLKKLEKLLEEKDNQSKNFETSKQQILDKLTNEKLQCMVENDKLKKLIEKKDKEIDDFKVQHDELTSEVVKMTENLSDELDRKQKEINEKTKEIAKLKESLDEAKNDISKANTTLAAQKEKFESDLNQRNSEIAILKGSNDYLRKRLEQKESHNEDDSTGISNMSISTPGPAKSGLASLYSSNHKNSDFSKN